MVSLVGRKAKSGMRKSDRSPTPPTPRRFFYGCTLKKRWNRINIFLLNIKLPAPLQNQFEITQTVLQV